MLGTTRVSPVEAKAAAKNIVKLYVLADKFVMSDLKNDILDHYNHLNFVSGAEIEIHHHTINFLTDNDLETCNV